MSSVNIVMQHKVIQGLSIILNGKNQHQQHIKQYTNAQDFVP